MIAGRNMSGIYRSPFKAAYPIINIVQQQHLQIPALNGAFQHKSQGRLPD